MSSNSDKKKNVYVSILFACLLVILALLFIFAGRLSRKRYLANIRIVEADCVQVLNNEGAGIRDRLRTAERDIFALFDEADMDISESLSKRLFLLDNGVFVPYRIPQPAGEGVVNTAVGMDDTLRPRILEAWKIAGEISALATNMAIPFRIAYGEYVLSVNHLGRACLMPLDMFREKETADSITRITIKVPEDAAAISHQLRYPPVCVWIPVEQMEVRKQTVKQAYILTNIMLVLMFAMITGLGTGIFLIVKRRHEMAKLKSSFVSSVSHELRTPMALIRLYAESLSDKNATPESRARYTRVIMAEIDRLLSLVNNVLDFSRLEKGLMELDVVSVNISKICNDTLDAFSFRLEEEKIRVTRKIEPDVMAMADPLAITQIIFNIVDNAIKYSPAESVVEVEIQRTDTQVYLRVKDNGAGIDDSLKPRIFMPFVRGTDSQIASQRGSGIGLSIVAQLAERMDCRINVSDNKPNGTVFEILMITSQ